MVLFSYSRIYTDQRLSARITRGTFVASYKGILKSKQEARVVFSSVVRPTIQSCYCCFNFIIIIHFF